MMRVLFTLFTARRILFYFFYFFCFCIIGMTVKGNGSRSPIPKRRRWIIKLRNYVIWPIRQNTQLILKLVSRINNCDAMSEWPSRSFKQQSIKSQSKFAESYSMYVCSFTIKYQIIRTYPQAFDRVNGTRINLMTSRRQKVNLICSNVRWNMYIPSTWLS